MKPQEAQILVNAAANIANSACKFLEVTKAHKKKGGMDTGRQLSESNDELVRVISEIAEAVRPLPGTKFQRNFTETKFLKDLKKRSDCSKKLKNSKPRLKNSYNLQVFCSHEPLS